MNTGCASLPHSCARLFLVVFALLQSAVFGQRGGLNDPHPLQDFSVTYRTAPGTGVLIFKLFSERTSVHLDRQALLKLINVSNDSAMWQTSDDNSQGVFTDIPYGHYKVEISAVGYLSTGQELQVMNSLRPAEIDIVLKKDPSAINLDVGSAIMSPKARKEVKHAISLLKSGNLAGAQKQLDQAYKLAPSSPDLNFLLGYLYFQKKDLQQAGSYLGAAAHLSPNNAQALTLLGRTNLERQDYPAARSALEQAILADAENWLPHNLLADAYLHESNYEKARNEAEIAISKGKNQATPARLVLGEALVGLGRDQEGVQTLNSFLQESPRSPMAEQVRNLIAELSMTPPTPAASPTAEVHIAALDPVAALPAPGLSVKPWQPPGVDDIRPVTVPNTVCPLAKVLDESGKRVQELVEDVARFAAVEDLFHQALDSYGIPVRTETRKYNYVAAISEPQPGVLNVDEYRAEKLTLQGYPDQIASTGFAALALVFHPDMRDSFDMACEGLGDWQHQPTWLVHFRQRDDRPNHMHSYKVGNQMHSVGLKGRAWITADKFQIVRMEAEMINPMPEIQLLSEHQIVEYGPVPFAKKNTTLWLPKSAEIYFDFRKHRYFRRHSFDHYMLFAVDAEEKRKEPTVKPADKPEIPQNPS
jgi:tetratricopeptide (TPR) repeat protein